MNTSDQTETVGSLPASEARWRTPGVLQKSLASGGGGLNEGRRSLPWWAWVAGISLALLLITAADVIGLDHEWKYLWRLTETAPLTLEWTLGAWWSSVSLFAVALISYDLSATKDTDFKLAWLGLAFITAFLSLDEIGSIHERLHLLGRLDRFLLAALAVGLVLLYVVVKLLRHRETRTAGTLIILAFGLLTTVAGQEQLEFAIGWSELPLWMSAVRAVLEEGTELAATMLLLAAVVTQRGGAGGQPIQAIIPDLSKVGSTAMFVLVGLVLNVAAYVYVLPHLTERGGSPAVWYPAMMNVILFGAAYWLSRDSRGWMRYAWQALAAGFLLSSAAIMTDVLILLPGVRRLMPDVWSRLLAMYFWQALLIAWMVRKRYIVAARGRLIIAGAIVLMSLHVYLAREEGLVLVLYSAFLCLVGAAVWSGARSPRTQVRSESLSGG